LVVDRTPSTADVNIIPEWCNEVAILNAGGSARKDLRVPVGVGLTEGEYAIGCNLNYGKEKCRKGGRVRRKSEGEEGYLERTGEVGLR